MAKLLTTEGETVNPDQVMERVLQLCQQIETGVWADATFQPLAVALAKEVRNIDSLMTNSNRYRTQHGRHDYTPTRWRAIYS